MKTSLITHKVMERLEEAGIQPKKSLGQNFLVNEGIYKKIVEAGQFEPSDIIVEVGPGIGILTDLLVQTGARIIAVEKDDVLAEYLKKRYSENNRIEIVHEDILKFNPQKTLPASERGNYKLIGNIPYYLTAHLFRVIFDPSAGGWPRPKTIVFTLQKEVAQRIIAKPPRMNLLAVSIQYYASPKIMSYVSKGSFYPMPKVDSAITKLESLVKDQESREESERFFKVVRAGFSNKRKQLANNLSSIFKLPRPEVNAKLSLAAVAPMRRAETLTIEEWQKIAKIFFLPH
jgi:16S rRNA (adenine1518-N6/adenine1519-N6)-dimethyltransferase